VKTLIRKMGNSLGVLMPKPLLAEFGANSNDPVNIWVENGKIVISLIRKKTARRLGGGEQEISCGR
jgi:antitoxin MazE